MNPVLTMINDTIIHFKGNLNTESIDSLINQFKKEQEKNSMHVSVFKKIITIMIETLENIYKYTRALEMNYSIHSDLKPEFILKKEGKTYTIISSNPIHKDDIQDLTKKIDLVQQLSSAELKTLYIDTIRNGKFSSQGGAGLGFIKIARVTDNQLKYTISPGVDNLSYYTLEIKINDEHE